MDDKHPLIGIICSHHTTSAGVGMQSVTHYYLDAVAKYMGVPAVLLPADIDASVAVERLDGLLLTGSRSNIHPREYGVGATGEHEPYDEARDALALPLIRAALAADLPMLAICRGLQELNVACGGTLVAAVHEIDGRCDHREAENKDERFSPRHEIEFVEGGVLQKLIGAGAAQVNSLHRQAIDKLGAGLVAEAHAPDGTIEAIRHTSARFCLGVQWHPEHQPTQNTTSKKLFSAFREALG